MIKFKDLFSFKRNEIQAFLKEAKLCKQIKGLKLLQAPFSLPDSEQNHGKLLVVTPRRSGKAHKRNQLRRRIKAVFYEEKLYQKHVASILFVYKEAMELDFNQIKEFLTDAFKK
jgi:ribonuclease P protein component